MYKRRYYQFMKSIIKKLFSLLLVGVVAISMISSIKPNCVDAAETNRYRAGKIVISCVPGTVSKEHYIVHCIVHYYNVFGIETMEPCSETLRDGDSRTYDIHGDVHKISIHTSFDGVKVLPPVKSSYERVPGEKPNPTEQSILYTIRSPFDPKSPGFNEKVGNGWHGCSYLPGS